MGKMRILNEKVRYPILVSLYTYLRGCAEVAHKSCDLPKFKAIHLVCNYFYMFHAFILWVWKVYKINYKAAVLSLLKLIKTHFALVLYEVKYKANFVRLEMIQWYSYFVLT